MKEQSQDGGGCPNMALTLRWAPARTEEPDAKSWALQLRCPGHLCSLLRELCMLLAAQCSQPAHTLECSAPLWAGTAGSPPNLTSDLWADGIPSFTNCSNPPGVGQ